METLKPKTSPVIAAKATLFTGVAFAATLAGRPSNDAAPSTVKVTLAQEKPTTLVPTPPVVGAAPKRSIIVTGPAANSVTQTYNYAPTTETYKIDGSDDKRIAAAQAEFENADPYPKAGWHTPPTDTTPGDPTHMDEMTREEAELIAGYTLGTWFSNEMVNKYASKMEQDIKDLNLVKTGETLVQTHLINVAPIDGRDGSPAKASLRDTEMVWLVPPKVNPVIQDAKDDVKGLSALRRVILHYGNNQYVELARIEFDSNGQFKRSTFTTPVGYYKKIAAGREKGILPADVGYLIFEANPGAVNPPYTKALHEIALYGLNFEDGTRLPSMAEIASKLPKSPDSIKGYKVYHEIGFIYKGVTIPRPVNGIGGQSQIFPSITPDKAAAAKALVGPSGADKKTNSTPIPAELRNFIDAQPKP